ncbi:hypothetical protein [Spirosoma flavum]|uniref:hypothetical protein n=1 Tax=Spirosoma flavum TaxID=2048557 RepID=UPI0036D3503D
MITSNTHFKLGQSSRQFKHLRVGYNCNLTKLLEQRFISLSNGPGLSYEHSIPVANMKSAMLWVGNPLPAAPPNWSPA